MGLGERILTGFTSPQGLPRSAPMRTVPFALVLLAACGGEAAVSSAETSTTTETSGTETSGIAPADGVQPRVQGPVHVRIAELDETFEPRLPDSRFDPGTSQPWIAIYGPRSWAILLDAPENVGHFDAAGNRVRLQVPGTTTEIPVRGSLDVDAIDPSTGRLAFTVRGEAVVDGMDAEVAIDVDTTLTALP